MADVMTALFLGVNKTNEPHSVLKLEYKSINNQPYINPEYHINITQRDNALPSPTPNIIITHPSNSIHHNQQYQHQHQNQYQ